MTTDDFLREQMERSQRQQTHRRRNGRSRRRQVYLLGGFALLGMLVLGAPSLVSHSSIGRSMLSQTAADYGLDATAQSVRVGWITPLRITGLQMVGKSGKSELSVQQLDTEWTVADLLGRSGDSWGETLLRGVNVACVMKDGQCSLEEDLEALLEPSEEDAGGGLLKLQEVTFSVTDAATGRAWQISKSNSEIATSSESLRAKFAGVLTEPSGRGGSLQGEMELAGDQWQLDLECESLPLSVLSLVQPRFQLQPHRQSPSSAPADAIAARDLLQIEGDATGVVRLVGAADGAIEASLRKFQVRNLTAADGNHRVWTNQLAMLDGDLILLGDRIIGRRLQASTDFASATMDGSMARSISLVGANDNPMLWLDAWSGSATAEIDLASLDRALPGLIPLRKEAQLVSGRAFARLQSLPTNGTAKRNQLILQSDELRARSRGRGVVIDPIELSAVVATDKGRLSAEQFELDSTFAKASGRGDLRSGSAKVDIDFGRLSAMLRPIFEVSQSNLSGSASGNIRWNASADNVWRLSGSGDATNLLITAAGGQTFRRPSLRGSVEAVGRWGGRSLDELTEANVRLASTGLDLRADLTAPVRRPSSEVPMPVRIQGDGRLETLAETIAPWLPEEIHDAEGGFSITARGQFSSAAGRVDSAAIELTSPRIAYRERYYSQPELKLFFDGRLDLPSGDFQSQSLTVASDAFSFAARGTAHADAVDLEVNWKAKLERLQGSVRKQLATRPDAAVRQVGYRPGAAVKTDDWLVMGDCEGDLKISGHGDQIDFDTLTTGKNLAVIQPPEASAGFHTVGPMPGRGQSSSQLASRVVWYEPNLRIDGAVSVDRSKGTILANSMQVASDWFATSLSGRAMWNQTTGEVTLKGPTKLKMNEVASRLSKLAGTEIHAEGIQETPLEISAVRDRSGHVAFSVVGNLGWEAGDVAGMRFGPASIPVRLTETTVFVSPAVIPVGAGQLNLAGQVHYRPGPLWLQAQGGVVARSVRLTPEITGRWLKYLAPLVADATNIEGAFSADLDEALVVFEQPELSRVSGRLNIEGARMTAGPLANQIVGGIEQLKAIGRAVGAARAGNNLADSNRVLIEMPPQTVDFTVADGVVTHKTLFFEVDRAQVVTSGRVSLDGRLNMVAQVPLDARWLGSDLQGLAGQPVTLPIDGTLSRPSLDSRGVRQVVSQLGAQAVQSTAENYLQKQLNRGLDKIFGR